MPNSNIHVLKPQLKLTFQDFTVNGKPSITQNLIQALAKLHKANTSELMIYTSQRKRFSTKIQVHFTRDLLLERHICITAPEAIRIEHEHNCSFEFDISHSDKSKSENEQYLKLHLCRFFKVVVNYDTLDSFTNEDYSKAYRKFMPHRSSSETPIRVSKTDLLEGLRSITKDLESPVIKYIPSGAEAFADLTQEIETRTHKLYVAIENPLGELHCMVAVDAITCQVFAHYPKSNLKDLAYFSNVFLKESS
ncbi:MULTISPECIES: hypothetical protein [Pseudomonas]|uniref:hypothetical protein n=1 Tax=Pseudomonas TaxID=286 RepID=UPI0015A16A0E|nr:MULTISPECIES: hypothetical protein [Pseudomonas]NWA46424.1 hypothetical protein [Pseudomonas reactans]NWC39680.1 hypothetical protein [Pseudomonas tolaasii]NWC90394.1 hypothetical protein [Pseudomonas reactans]NWF17409.1 hypothetical protein [Pseudomonas reactans]